MPETSLADVIHWIESHRCEWTLQDGRLFVIEHVTVLVKGKVIPRFTWIEATDWTAAETTDWLGY